MVWIESGGRLAILHGGQDVANRRGRGETHGRSAEAEPDRAQPHLLGGFLARDIDDATAFARQPRGDLKQQGRLADPGVAADEHCRSRDDAAADGAVELGKPARQTIGQGRGSLQPDQRNDPPAALEVVLGRENA